MIYVIIADYKNRDCRAIRQPYYILPQEIEDYIQKNKNENLRDERRCAYTALLCSFEKFYSLSNQKIKRNQNGKPYFENNEIYFSISHCDGVAVVALSDEGEIGVDIQSPVDKKISERIDARFLSNVHIKKKNINAKYFTLTFNEEAVFKKISPQNDSDSNFISKWVYTESLIKCFGSSFSDISKINELSINTASEIVCYDNFKIATTVAK